MEYYKFRSKDLHTVCVAIPSDRWLETAKCLVFRDRTLGLPFEFSDEFDAICNEAMFGAEATREADKIESFHKITREQFIENNGVCDAYEGREEYFIGKLPEDWYQTANDTFINNKLITELACNDDLQRVVDDNSIEQYIHIELIWDNMFGYDPVDHLEKWSRYLYGLAISCISGNKYQ